MRRNTEDSRTRLEPSTCKTQMQNGLQGERKAAEVACFDTTNRIVARWVGCTCATVADCLSVVRTNQLAARLISVCARNSSPGNRDQDLNYTKPFISRWSGQGCNISSGYSLILRPKRVLLDTKWDPILKTISNSISIHNMKIWPFTDTT